MASLGSLKSAIFHREERKMQYQSHIRGLNAYDRHKKFMNDYVQFYGNTKNVHNDMPIKTDQDTIREGYRFIISEDDDMDSTWEKRLVKRYYDKLFKEYCIADMSQYKMGKIGLRWRTEKEVISGKGQFICGNRACNEKESLGSYEVNFSYTEAGESKQALVKLVACKRCSEKLVYKRKKEKEHSPVREKEKYKRKRERGRDGDSTDDEYDKSTNRSRKGAIPAAEVYVHLHNNACVGGSISMADGLKIRIINFLNSKVYLTDKAKDFESACGSFHIHPLSFFSLSSRTGQKTSSSANDGRTDEDNFEEFLEGMFP